MRAVIQRVTSASVTIEGIIKGRINHGFLILLGVGLDDNEEVVRWMVKKIAQLRIFSDADGKMNNSLLDVNGEALVISQFTLLADSEKGNRPSYIRAARPEKAIPLYELFCSELQLVLSHPVQTGIFAADMKVELLNDGPVTIVLDSPSKLTS